MKNYKFEKKNLNISDNYGIFLLMYNAQFNNKLTMETGSWNKIFRNDRLCTFFVIQHKRCSEKLSE
jgi:hypothetical protein